MKYCQIEFDTKCAWVAADWTPCQFTKQNGTEMAGLTWRKSEEAAKCGRPGQNQERLGKDERGRKCVGRRLVTQDFLNLYFITSLIYSNFCSASTLSRERFGFCRGMRKLSPLYLIGHFTPWTGQRACFSTINNNENQCSTNATPVGRTSAMGLRHLFERPWARDKYEIKDY